MSWINFKEVAIIPPQKTKVWHVYTVKGEEILGSVKWFGRWRRYAFFPLNSVFEQDCLRDIANFIEEKTREHRAKVTH